VNIFQRIFQNRKRQNNNGTLGEKAVDGSRFSLTSDEDIHKFYLDPFNDTFLCNAWVNIAVNILIRNIARADFCLEKNGGELKSGYSYSQYCPRGFLSGEERRRVKKRFALFPIPPSKRTFKQIRFVERNCRMVVYRGRGFLVVRSRLFGRAAETTFYS